MSEMGYTGPDVGMSLSQMDALRYLLRTLDVSRLHHGDCVGGDAEADSIGRFMGIQMVIHPPLDPKKRAFCESSMPHEIREPKNYLKRDFDIAKEGVNGLIAATRGETEQHRGSGVWATIRYARKLGRRIWKVLPDGSIRPEESNGTARLVF